MLSPTPPRDPWFYPTQSLATPQRQLPPTRCAVCTPRRTRPLSPPHSRPHRSGRPMSKTKQGPPGFGQNGAKSAALAPEEASGRPTLRPASAHQPLVACAALTCHTVLFFNKGGGSPPRWRLGRAAACRTSASPRKTRPGASAAAPGETCASASLSPALSGVVRRECDVFELAFSPPPNDVP